MAFFAATAHDDLGPFWLLAVDSGMRLGELIALRWQDVDTERGIVRVRRTLTRTRDGGWQIGERPKTAAGRRPIVLMAETVTVLAGHREAQAERRRLFGATWHDDDLVFDRGDGRSWAADAIRQTFDRAITEAGLPRITPHQMRHTCGSLLGSANVNPKAIQERLGHTTIAQTMKYVHTVPTAQDAAAAALADLFRKARHQNGTKSDDDGENVASS